MGHKMAKRPTPMERLLNGESTDRRRRYEERMRAQGFVRTTVQVPPRDVEFMKAVARYTREGMDFHAAVALAVDECPESTLGLAERARGAARTERSEGARLRGNAARG